MSAYEHLQIGQHVIFHDDWQREISGTVETREDCGNHILYTLNLDEGGQYVARLPKSDAGGTNAP